MSFLAAVKFLTILRLPYRGGESAEEIGRSVVYFPAVGLIIGLVLSGLYQLLVMVLPPALVNALALAGLALFSGALHLDGFMDTVDGLAGHKPVEERWKVMRDSRVGAFGVVGVVLLLLVKYGALNSIPPGLVPAALVIAPLAGRWAMVFVLFAFRYARPKGLGAALKPFITPARFSIATVFTMAAVMATAWLAGMSYFIPAGLVILVGVWVIIEPVAIGFNRMFSGLTGDNYGAVNEIAELALLVIFALLAYNRWLF